MPELLLEPSDKPHGLSEETSCSYRMDFATFTEDFEALSLWTVDLTIRRRQAMRPLFEDIMYVDYVSRVENR